MNQPSLLQQLLAGDRTTRIPQSTHLTPSRRVRSGTRIVFADGAGKSTDDYLLSGCDAEDITTEVGIWDGYTDIFPELPA
jgi:hypothetical protein